VLNQRFVPSAEGQVQAVLAGWGASVVPELKVRHLLDSGALVNLSPGTVRLKRGGGSGGHNGLKDITAAMGGPDYGRLRIGIGHPRDLYPGREVVDFVLQRPSHGEQNALDDAIRDALAVVPVLAAGQWERAGQKLHTVPKAT
jgi:PTH1 family peptidyl-tRNA hydrolase